MFGKLISGIGGLLGKALPVIGGLASGGTLGTALSLGGGLYNMFKGGQSANQAMAPYDLSGIQAAQAPLMQAYKGIGQQGQDASKLAGEMYQQGSDQYALGQSYLDPGSEPNQLIRKSLMGSALDSVGLQNQLSQRTPYGAPSGISQANLAANSLRAQGQATDSYVKALQGQQQFGGQLMGQGSGMQRGAIGQQLGAIAPQLQALGGQKSLMENILQGELANQSMARQQSAYDAQRYSDTASGLFDLIPQVPNLLNLFSSGSSGGSANITGLVNQNLPNMV